MALSEIDRTLLDRSLARQPRAWEDFVDRFMGLIVHVINHTTQARSIRLAPQDREDLCAEVFLTLIRDDFAILRRFRGQSSLATYLTVVARRVVARQLMSRKSPARLGRISTSPNSSEDSPDVSTNPAKRVSDRDQVERLMASLDDHEANVVRLYHLEGKSYREISDQVGMPENSVGPTLSRAREKMRRFGVDPAAR